ncbi:hypothetical protein [Pseudofrankia saprophytica]|uniref:hypothetical protein n=1 Tax=Pseudofrankia saprophytica TaxID=298655 RepID=UPI000234B9A0|nr:hypothetical protein [Pseudofrankia saprophytica]
MVTTLTTRIPRTWVIPTPDAAQRAAEADRSTLRILTVLMFCELFLQRISVPVGGTGVSVVLPVVLFGMLLMVARGGLRIHLVRTRAYLIAMAVCCAVAFLAFTRGEDNVSLNSLLLLVAVYAPFCLGLSRAHSKVLLPRLLDRFVIMTSVFAGLAVLQFALQLVGWKYSDVLASIVPSQFLAHDFNTSYPVRYGSTLYKSNAFLGLEASYTSQFLAMGLVVGVLRKMRWWRYPLYLLAILSTVSGTGVLLLGVAGVLLAVHKGVRFTVSALAIVGVIVAVLSLTPAADIFASRATETSSSQSSGSLRFVQPYTRMYDDLSQHPGTALVGHGPGWSDRDSAAFLARTGLPLNYALVPKLILEYGLIGGVAFLLFLATAFIRGSPSFVLSGSLLFFYFVLSSSLLSPVVGYLVLLLLTWFCEDLHPLVSRKPAYRRAVVPAQRSYAEQH